MDASTKRTDAGPGDVPFAGWSQAAHEFRRNAAEFARSESVRPLIMGDPGVGKRTMARAWQVASGRDPDRVRIQALEYASIGLPTCFIGVTTSRPPLGRYCVLLGSGTRGQAPAPDYEGGGLEVEILDYFGLPLYMPPISPARGIDVLAFLDYWNKARSPFVGIRYKALDLSFLRRLVLGDPPPDNLEGVYKRLRMINHRNRPAPPGTSADVPPVEVETLGSRRGEGRPVPPGDESSGRGSDPEEGEIPFDAIPDLAVRIYLWCCQHEPPEDGAVVQAEPDGPGGRLPGSLSPFLGGLTAKEFLRMGEDEFVRDHVIPGLAAEIAGRPDHLPLLLHRVRHRPVFGTTFGALQEGLQIDPVQVEARLGRPTGDSRTNWSTGAGPLAGGAAVVPPEGAPRGWSGNRFCVEETTYHIVFWQPGGRVEQGRFLLGKNFGIDYYHHLVHNPERAISAQQLESEVGRKERDSGLTTQAGSVEAGFSTGTSFDPILDEEGKRTFLRRITELREDIDKAIRRGDEISERCSQEELDALTAELVKARHKSRQKGLDPSAKQARDRVRKAMDDARAKLTHAGLPALACYLKDRVRFKEGKWTYLPPKSSTGWQS